VNTSRRITVCPPTFVAVPPDGVEPGLPGADTGGALDVPPVPPDGAGAGDVDPVEGADPVDPVPGLVPPPALTFTRGENGS
jgi:hypothetical protein